MSDASSRCWRTVLSLTALLALACAMPARAQQVFSDGFEPSVPDIPATDAEAARFLTQATFGPTLAEIQRLRSMGYNAWLNEQFTLPASHQVPYLDMIGAIPEPVYSNARMEAWWLNAVRGDDHVQAGWVPPASDALGAIMQLRQRREFTAFAREQLASARADSIAP